MPRPGEISLAHGGVLFLDELTEYRKEILELLRQPLENRSIEISRAYGKYQFPANFILVAAMNPCPCGCYPDMERCKCTQAQIRAYLGKVSMPFLDRIDLCTEATAGQLRRSDRTAEGGIFCRNQKTGLYGEGQTERKIPWNRYKNKCDAGYK